MFTYLRWIFPVEISSGNDFISIDEDEGIFRSTIHLGCDHFLSESDCIPCNTVNLRRQIEERNDLFSLSLTCGIHRIE